MIRGIMSSAAIQKINSWKYWLTLGILLLMWSWHAWMTLSLFGHEDCLDNLTNDAPILSGMHALHLYHGVLGAQSILQSGTWSCYDPSFQAGYPKTPIFDTGSRPAEFVQLCVGGSYCPKSYKLGLLITCLLVPALIIVAARGFSLSWPVTLISMALGLIVWWGTPGLKLIHSGEIELVIAGLFLLAHVGLLAYYERNATIFSWVGVFATGAIGWYAQPLIFPILLPILMIYYLGAGVKHRMLSWHLGLFSALLCGFLINLPWLIEWMHYWWIRAPLPPAIDTLPHRTIRTVWMAPIWGNALDRAVAVSLIVLGCMGLFILETQKKRIAAKVLGMGGTLLLVLALLGVSWEPLGQVGTASLLVPALWFACLTTGVAVVWAVEQISRLRAGKYYATPLVLALLVGSISAMTGEGYFELENFIRPQPLTVGLNERRWELIDTLKKRTSSSGRILWEDLPLERTVDSLHDSARWTALLPELTHRQFIGGLDPTWQIEHSHIGLVWEKLADRPISQWNDDELKDYCRRYNVGWIVAWSEATIHRFRNWSSASEICPVADARHGYLFRVERPSLTYTLHGQATVQKAGTNTICLSEVVPENGKVVLSFHFQEGMRVSPSRVEVERELDPMDPVPLIRLKSETPISRLTIRWEPSIWNK